MENITKIRKIILLSIILRIKVVTEIKIIE